MVLTFEEEKELLQMKHDMKKEIMHLQHINTMDELQRQLEIAKVEAKIEVD